MEGGEVEAEIQKMGGQMHTKMFKAFFLWVSKISGYFYFSLSYFSVLFVFYTVFPYIT